MKGLPTVSEISREALIVIAGALLAALVMSQFPSVRKWIKDQWA